MEVVECCFTFTETVGLLGTGRSREKGGLRWGRGRLYTYRHTVTTRMTSAFRWAAMRAVLMFIIVRDKACTPL